jgi:6-phosphofructokinase
MKLGILCGGGPAPGMNSVISAATIEARNRGWDVLGIMDGFQHLIEGRIEEARPLSITDVSRIHLQGGSIIRTSRANPTVRDEDAADPEWRLHACLESLHKLGIDALVTIGGDDTAFSASRLAAAAGGGLRVAHVPKTIDNDLPLPGGAPTFDIEYTRDLGYGAVAYLKRVLDGDEPGGMITIQEGHMVPLSFGSLSDLETGRVRIRLVNVDSSSYRVAREYMIRLDRQDLGDPGKLGPIAKAAGLTPEAFRDRYGYLAEG